MKPARLYVLAVLLALYLLLIALVTELPPWRPHAQSASPREHTSRSPREPGESRRLFDPVEIRIADRKLDRFNAVIRRLKSLNSDFFACENEDHRGVVFEHKGVHAEVVPSTAWLLQSLGLTCIDMLHVKPLRFRHFFWCAGPLLCARLQV